MKFAKTFIIISILIFGFLVALFYTGIPTFNDRYLEQATKNSVFTAFSDSSTRCSIRLIPEILDRLIVDVKFDHKGYTKEYLKDMNLKIFSANQEQQRIFDISIHKYNQSINNFEETRVNTLADLSKNSVYRDFSFTFQSQYKLDKKDKFEIHLSVILADLTTKEEKISIEFLRSLTKKSSSLSRLDSTKQLQATFGLLIGWRDVEAISSISLFNSSVGRPLSKHNFVRPTLSHFLTRFTRAGHHKCQPISKPPALAVIVSEI